jgi:hypothetical protein
VPTPHVNCTIRAYNHPYMHFVRKRVQHAFHFYGAKFILRICWYVAYTNGCRIFPFVMFGAASFLSVGHLTCRPRTSSHKYYYFSIRRAPLPRHFLTPHLIRLYFHNIFCTLPTIFIFCSHGALPIFSCMHGMWIESCSNVAIIFVRFQKPSHATKHAPAVSGNNVTTSSPCGDT